jgi:putative ABC transport system ATP-binding protein
MGSEEVSLEGEHLTRSFGKGDTLTVALHDVSLHLQTGQFTLVMGPSGCGKTTLLALLSGLLRPDSGQVLALGQDLWRLSDSQRREFRLRHFGFIFQGYNLFPVLTAREQLEMVVRWGEGGSRQEVRKRAAQTLDLLGMSRKADLLPTQLSGGEKQRVAIGRALIKRPEFCFADEPTSALDWAHGKHIVELLHEAAHDNGATVMVVAHDARIAHYADQVLHLDDGVLVETETVSGPAPLGTP